LVISEELITFALANQEQKTTEKKVFD